MNRQRQEVSSEGLGIQGGRDVVLNLGPTAEQFATLMVEVGKQLAVFHAEGLQKVDERLSTFKDEVLKEFAKGTAADPEALKDPDFQAALHAAQEGFVRSSDEDVSASLINLITVRSQLTGRSRASLSLNAAIEVVASLTGEEIALLTAIFHSYRAVVQSSNPDIVLRYLQDHVVPQVSMMSINIRGSIDYLISRGCLLQTAFGQGDYADVIMREYATALTDEFTLEELKAAVPDLDVSVLAPVLEATAVNWPLGSARTIGSLRTLRGE